MSKMIYLDNAATTRTAPEVVEAMLPYFTEMYGNPSSIYEFAGKSKEGVTKARGQIAAALGAVIKINNASSYCFLILNAPCTSISKITLCPAASSSSTNFLGVP